MSVDGLGELVVCMQIDDSDVTAAFVGKEVLSSCHKHFTSQIMQTCNTSIVEDGCQTQKLVLQSQVHGFEHTAP